MSELASIHSGLRRLRLLRLGVRLGAGAAAALAAVLWALAAAFLLDFWVRMGRLERAVLLAAVAGTAAWAFLRHLLPALRAREDEVGLALLVERQQGLSSDLVAAIQFADARRAQYGSAALRQAVVEYTAEAAGGLDFLEGLSARALWRRGAVLAAGLVVVVLPAVLMPSYAGAFLDRLFLGSAHYPTRTVIEQVVSPAGESGAFGQPVDFAVRASGELPPGGQVELRALGGSATTAVELKPRAGERGLYAGRLERLLDDVEWTVRLGDAYTEPRRLKLIPLARVEVALDVSPPDYAADRYRAEAARKRQPPAPEGSAVTVVVSADKVLASGVVTIDKQDYPLRAEAGRLRLPPAGTPLAGVVEPVRFRVQVTDADGLGLDRPVAGMVQVLADRPPRIAAAAVTRYVLPAAAPVIRWGATDDYGVARVLCHRTVLRADGERSGDSLPVAELSDRPGSRSDSYRLDLSGLSLAKGDRLVVTMEAVDWRGAGAGRSSRSDPLTFLVTDKQGLLEAMEKLDERTVEKLDQIIRAQLGIGE